MIDFEAARAILRKNDRGAYTVPTDGLYPFQWSWDSAITAMGWMHIDETRAWREAETMFAGQWPNGMLPHILFHGDAASYFPGPDVWGTASRIRSSAISQPPVWATAIRRMLQSAEDGSLAEAKVRALLPGLLRYHRWWYRERDPDNTGLVCSFHPWESGMDNSPAWDQALARVAPVSWEYRRRDLGHVESEQRPHKPEYDRYLALVDFFKHSDFEEQAIYANCPYRVVDVGIVSILRRAGKDLQWLCREVDPGIPTEDIDAELERTDAAVHRLWSETSRCFFNYDAIAAEPLPVVTTATLLPLFGGLATAEQAASMAAMLDQWLDAAPFGVTSTHPSSASFEPQRYWRGPVWLHINWMLALGLAEYGHGGLADRVRASARECVEAGGFFEYFNARTGSGCGGADFSWTAAVALFWLED